MIYVNKLTSNQRLKLKTTGRQFRDFVTLADVCKGTEVLLNKTKAQTLDGLFNLGSGIGTRVITMARLIQERYQALFGEKIEIETTEIKKENIKVLNYSIKRLCNLGFRPTNDFTKEIDSVLIYCMNRFKRA